MTQGPEGDPRVLLEAAEIADNYAGEHTKDQIGGIYSRFKTTLSLVNITPETAQHDFSTENWVKPKPYHFLDLPGRFYIRYHGRDDDALLVVRRVLDLESGGYIGEHFSINPKGNLQYNLMENDPRGYYYSQILDRGALSLGAAENDLATVNKFNSLQAQLHETITRQEHRPESIQQEMTESFQSLLKVFRKRKKLVLPGIGSVDAGPVGKVKTNDRGIAILEQERVEIMYVYEDGTGFVHSDEGEAHIDYRNGQLDIRDPHFMAMRIREFKEALGNVA